MTRNNPLHTTRSLFSLLVVFLFVQMKGYAQQNNSLYFMEGIPQSNQLNPATQPRFGLYIGMPALSSIEVNAGNSTFGFNDLAHATVNDILQIDTLLPKALKNNFINGELRIDWLSFGFRIN